MRVGNIYFTFDQLKDKYNLPEDALLKNINVHNESGEIEITYYTNDTTRSISFEDMEEGWILTRNCIMI